jgi:hypothetical protein
MIGITLDQQQFVAVRARLRAAGEGGLLRELNKALKSAATEVRLAEQTAATALPAHGAVHTGLRAQIAAATAVRVTDSKSNPGVRIYVQEGKVPGKLGRDTNRARGWRHPVWGDKNVWVTQVMSPDWWGRAARPHYASARDKCVQALQATVRAMAGH